MSATGMTRVQIAEKQARLKEELAVLEAEEQRLLSLSDDARLAEELHSMQCRWNHTDGCGWCYEISKGVVDWNGHAHNSYLRKAREVMKVLPDLSVDEILRVASAIK